MRPTTTPAMPPAIAPSAAPRAWSYRLSDVNCSRATSTGCPRVGSMMTPAGMRPVTRSPNGCGRAPGGDARALIASPLAAIASTSVRTRSSSIRPSACVVVQPSSSAPTPSTATRSRARPRQESRGRRGPKHRVSMRPSRSLARSWPRSCGAARARCRRPLAAYFRRRYAAKPVVADKGLFVASCSVTTTRRRRFMWVAWWTAPPAREPFRKPDAFSGGARSHEEALAQARRAAGVPLVEIQPYWARAWARVLLGRPPWGVRAEGGASSFGSHGRCDDERRKDDHALDLGDARHHRARNGRRPEARVSAARSRHPPRSGWRCGGLPPGAERVQGGPAPDRPPPPQANPGAVTAMLAAANERERAH